MNLRQSKVILTFMEFMIGATVSSRFPYQTFLPQDSRTDIMSILILQIIPMQLQEAVRLFHSKLPREN